MSKIDLTPIQSGYNLGKINANFEKIEQELNGKVLYRDNTATPNEPNQMENDLDMNSKRIINLPAPIDPTEALRKGDFTLDSTGATVQYVDDTVSAVSVTLNEEITRSTGDIKSFATLAAALSETDVLKIFAGAVITVQEHSAGNGGSATWDIIAGTGTDDGSFIRAHDTLDVSAVYRVKSRTVHAAEIGIIPGSGQTTEIATFLERIHDDKLLGVVLEGQYDVNGILLTKSTSGKFKLVCQDGEAVFDYTGTEVNHLIQSINCDHVLVKNITFEANSLVNTPLDLRKSSAFGGIAGLFNVNSNNAKEVASAGSAVGLQLSGSFAKVQWISCDVNGVSYTTLGRNATGMVLSNFAGIYEFNLCSVKNISTPEQFNADGIKVFGDDVLTITTRLAAKGEIHNCIFENCQDRFIKLQVSNTEIHSNLFLMANGTPTVTEWRGIDAQVGGCDIHHNNFVFGTGITWGTASNLVTFQNLRNDGTEQISRFQYNSISIQSAGLSVMANLSAEYGNNKFIICDNPCLGETIKKGFALRVGDGTNPIATAIANTDSVSVEYCDNTVEDYSGQDLLSIFDAVDYGNTVFLKIKNSTVKNIASISRLTSAAPVWTINHNFTLSNNIHTSNQVYWTFDIDFVYGENDFVVGAQAIGGTTPGLGNTVYYSVQGGVQRAYNTGGTLESRRTTSAPNAWFAWQAV